MKADRRKETIRQHYIPQFILRNFTFNNNGELYYYSLKENKIFKKKTRDIFMEYRLYNSETINPDDPTQIEKDFAKYEREIAHLIKEKILDKHDIFLTTNEEASLRFFCALLGIRSKNANDIFNNLDDEAKLMYSKYQQDGKFDELWKRNLSVLAKSRSFDEIVNRNDVDKPIKEFMQKDCFGVYGRYFIFLERRGPIDFLIGDCYPVVISGFTDFDLSLDLISFYPISPSLCIALVNSGAESAPCIASLNKYLKKPWQNKDVLRYKVQKLYEKDILNINDGTIKNSNYGVAFKDKKRIEIGLKK